MKPLLYVDSLNKHFNGIKALDDFSCQIFQSEITGLIGPNGAGKSTLFNVVTSLTPCESGNVFYKGINITRKSIKNIYSHGISRTFQQLRLIKHLSVLGNTLLAFQNQRGERLSSLFFEHKKCMVEERQNKEKALELLGAVGLIEQADNSANQLSYGQQKLLSLVCCLASDSDLLLLDEPVAGINPAMINKILSIILEQKEQGKTILLIEHNIEVVSEICQRVLFMDMGKLISDGTPEQVKNEKKVIDAYLE